MYRIQIWNEEVRSYKDAHVVFDHIGAVGLKAATSEEPATEWVTGDQAMQACEDLTDRIDDVCCVLDTATGRRYFDLADLPGE
jgi:hypothetical protein